MASFDSDSLPDTSSDLDLTAEEIQWLTTTDDDHVRDIDEAQAKIDADFPNAIDPAIWYANPPLVSDEPAQFPFTAFGRLDGKEHLRHMIWAYLVGPDREIDITVRVRNQGFVYPQPNPQFRDILAIAGVCRLFRKEILETMKKSIIFAHRCPANLGTTIRRIPKCITRHIGTLHLQHEGYGPGYLDVHHETAFAGVFDLMRTYMPNLVRFQLRCTYRMGGGWGPDVNPEEKQRTLLRFGAFLIAKHKNMDLLIWPGDSGPTFEPGQDDVSMYVDVASSQHLGERKRYQPASPKYLCAEDAENDVLSLVDDRLLNSTILRRLHWDTIITLSVYDLTISRESQTSEVDEGHDYFHQVDREGYMTRKQRAYLGKSFIPVDRLIDICEKRMRKAIDNGTYQTRPAGETTIVSWTWSRPRWW